MKKFILTISFLLLPAISLAAPAPTSYSGTVADGNSIVISGANFGTGPTIQKWDDFDGGTHTVGNTIGAGPAGQTAWTYRAASGSTTEPKVDNNSCRTGSSQHIRSTFDFDTDGNKYRNTFQFISGATHSPIYVTWWFRWDRVGATLGSNRKPYWPATDDDTNPSQPRVSSCYDEGGGGPSSCGGVHVISPDSGGSTKYWHGPSTESQWIRSEFYGVESSGGSNADGTVIWKIQWSNGAAFSTIFNKSGNVLTRGSEHWAACTFGDYCAMSSGIHYTHDFDDIYIANSQARVEIGNHQTWASCTHREIQEKTAWAAGSITATVNQGSIANPLDGNHYLFVIDSNGAVNTTGLPLVQGGAVTGTIVPGGCTESEIVPGGKTVDITLSGTTWVATWGENNAITTAFIAGFDSAQAEAGGWDAQMVITHANVSRISSTLGRVTLPATAGYQITAGEVITLIIPTTSTDSGNQITATPTFNISAEYISGESVLATYDVNAPNIDYSASGISMVAP